MIYYHFDKIFFSMATKLSRKDPDPAGPVINLPRGSERNIYGSGTLLLTITYMRNYLVPRL
jgi:hypothetical protein